MDRTTRNHRASPGGATFRSSTSPLRGWRIGRHHTVPRVETRGYMTAPLRGWMDCHGRSPRSLRGSAVVRAVPCRACGWALNDEFSKRSNHERSTHRVAIYVVTNTLRPVAPIAAMIHGWISSKRRRHVATVTRRRILLTTSRSWLQWWISPLFQALASVATSKYRCPTNCRAELSVDQTVHFDDRR